MFLDPDDLLRPTALEKLVLMAVEVIKVGSKDKDRGNAFALRTGLTPFQTSREKTKRNENNPPQQSQASCFRGWNTLVTNRT